MQSIHTAKKHLIDCHKFKHTVHEAVELARFHLAAGGGEWSGPNMLLWLLLSFVLGICKGGDFVTSERVSNCSHINGTIREPTMPTAHWLLYKAMCFHFPTVFTMRYTFDLRNRTEIYWAEFKILNVFDWIFSHFHRPYSPKGRQISYIKFLFHFKTVWLRQAAALPSFTLPNPQNFIAGGC